MPTPDPVSAPPPPAVPAFDEQSHLFLEEVEGEQALAWVRGENQRSLVRLKADPRFAPLEAEALELANAKDRIPYGSVRDGYVYNFWQDETHVRGLWRRTPEASYAAESPVWETLIDFDRLSADEGRNWVFKGANCLMPEGRLCLIALSDGGKDAVVNREFDIAAKAFVPGGFVTPEAKQDAEWLDADTLLIATDWGPEAGAPTVTASGYPFVVKRWSRGTPLSGAKTVFRGDADNVGVWPTTFEMDDGRILPGVVKAETFFTSTNWFLPASGKPIMLPAPLKASVRGLYRDWLLMTLEEDWSVARPCEPGEACETGEIVESFKAGDLVAYRFDDFLLTRLPVRARLVFRPGERQAIEGVSISKTAIVVTYSDMVATRVMTLTESPGGWTQSPVQLPANGAASVAFASRYETTVHLNFESFLTPPTLYGFDTAGQALAPLKSLPAEFDASPYEVNQFLAKSADGTDIPYYVVARKDLVRDRSTPTLLYGYGGFQVSMTPAYSPYVGKLWLDNGGAYVLANIRGGGEFGPAWHQAGLKTRRQVVYDDFVAVARNLIDTGLTSPEKLGAMGGSNGGLLMGVMFTQQPDLFAAIVCQVPLLDMLRYDKLLAGASWVDEYGDPDVPEERAFLEKLSPYHHIDPARDYPEIFFVTSTKDDRVHPAHARKMAKRLQELGKPFLYYENIDGGHSAAANLKEAAHRRALEYTYLMEKLLAPAPPLAPASQPAAQAAPPTQ